MLATIAAIVVAAASPAGDLSTRIADSAAAAQALQGPLDGTWTLSDGRGQPLYLFQITDPAGGAGPLEGAWRRCGVSDAAGLIEVIDRRGRLLEIRFAREGELVRLRLHRDADGAWSGEASENGRDRAVEFRRSAPCALPR